MKDKTKEFTNFIKQDFDIVEDYKESKEALQVKLHLFDNGQGDWVSCPTCNKSLGHPIFAKKIKKCPKCGQTLKELKW